MFPPRPTELAHRLLRGAIREGDLVIDATAGNGHDTEFLAECAGAAGRVIAFDVQAGAIEAARRRIGDSGYASRVEFHEACHSRIGEHAAIGTVAAVMFNLGYLPGGNHGITTERAATLRALESAAGVIKPGGVLSVVCYPGHEAGEDEASATESWMTGLTACGWRVAKFAMLGTLNPAPFLLIARKPGGSPEEGLVGI